MINKHKMSENLKITENTKFQYIATVTGTLEIKTIEYFHICVKRMNEFCYYLIKLVSILNS